MLFSKDSQKSPHSWRKIDQRSTQRGMSQSAAQKRKASNLNVLKRAILPLSVLGLIAGAVVLLTQLNFSGPSGGQSISQIAYESNGHLPAKWLQKQLKLRKGTTLMDVDIFELKGRLEGHGQVKSAIIERKFPSTLVVSLTEHLPIAKLAALGEDGKARLLLASGDGVLFTPEFITKDELAALPYLEDVSIFQDINGGFKPLEQMGSIAELLRTARTEYPHLYGQWKSLSLKHFKSAKSMVSSLIYVHTQGMGELIFDIKDFASQLTRLDEIYRYASTKHLRSIERIDLSLGSQVAVKLSHNR